MLFGLSHLNASSKIRECMDSKIRLVVLRRPDALDEMAVRPPEAALSRSQTEPAVHRENASPVSPPSVDHASARRQVPRVKESLLVSPHRPRLPSIPVYPRRLSFSFLRLSISPRARPSRYPPPYCYVHAFVLSYACAQLFVLPLPPHTLSSSTMCPLSPSSTFEHRRGFSR